VTSASIAQSGIRARASSRSFFMRFLETEIEGVMIVAAYLKAGVRNGLGRRALSFLIKAC